MSDSLKLSSARMMLKSDEASLKNLRITLASCKITEDDRVKIIKSIDYLQDRIAKTQVIIYENGVK